MLSRRLAAILLSCSLVVPVVACGSDDPTEANPVDPQNDNPSGPGDVADDEAGDNEDPDDPATIGGTPPQPPGAGDEDSGQGGGESTGDE